jgi:hypothetical protein
MNGIAGPAMPDDMIACHDRSLNFLHFPPRFSLYLAAMYMRCTFADSDAKTDADARAGSTQHLSARPRWLSKRSRKDHFPTSQRAFTTECDAR